MNEEQIRELNSPLTPEDLSDERFNPTGADESPSEIIEYMVAGLATGFLMVVIGFYLLHKYFLM